MYAAADFVAQMIIGEFYPWRLLAIALVGISVYRVEIPRWFAWIERFRLGADTLARAPWLQAFMILYKEDKKTGLQNASGAKNVSYRLRPIFKGALGTLYFNPLWIARHMLVLELATHPLKMQDGLLPLLAYCLSLGAKAFVINAPLSLCLNYLLQNKVPLRYRFIGSVFVSGFFGIMYSLLHRYL